jgi:hypothetical protein
MAHFYNYPVSCIISHRTRVYLHHDHLYICGSVNFASALIKLDHLSATNAPDVVAISAWFFIYQSTRHVNLFYGSFAFQRGLRTEVPPEMSQKKISKVMNVWR